MLRVLVGVLGRLRRGRHSGHRTPARVAAALALLAGFVLLPMAMQPASGASEKKVAFKVAFTGEVDSLNPFLGVEANSYELWSMMYDYLVNYSMKDMSPVPGLAKSWDTSSNGKTWTFHMRSGVNWSDGKPLTSKDVAYTYNRVLHGALEGNNWETYLNNVTKVTAPDPDTVVLSLRHTNAVLPLLPIPIVPQHIWKNVSEKEMKSFANAPKPAQPIVGSGSFRLVQGTGGGSTFRLLKNPHYWNGTPHVDEVDFTVYKSKDPAVQALIKGEVDFVEDINPLQVRALQKHDNIAAHNGISPLFDEIAFNTGAIDTATNKPLGDGNKAVQDPKFRHALGYALDRERIAQRAWQAAATPGTTIVPPAYPKWHWEPPAGTKFTFSIKKAGEELDKAGYKKGADGKRTMPNGKPIGTLRLFARSESNGSVDTMDYFKEWLSDLGIDSKVSAVDTDKLNDLIYSSGEYDAFEWDWYVEPDPDSILSDFTCDQRGGSSDSWYCDKAYDKMYQQQNGEMNLAKREQIVKRMQQKLYKDAPYLVTAYPDTGEAVRTDRFACFQPQPEKGGVWLVQYGTHNYPFLRPASQAGDCDGVTPVLGASSSTSNSSDSNQTVVWVLVAVVVLAAAGGAVLLLRRRATAAERE